MAQVANNAPFITSQPQSILPNLTKCGEIHINDDASVAFMFCLFCTDRVDEDTKFFVTLQEFKDHILWHRSDDLLVQKEEAVAHAFEMVDFEVATITTESFAADNGQTACDTKASAAANDEDGFCIKKSPTIDNLTEIPEDVIVKLLDLYKKCPCLWHKRSAETEEHLIEPSFKLLTKYYNNCTGQNASVDFVKNLVANISDSFMMEFTADEDEMNRSPWYFPHLMFLLVSDVPTLEESLYTDFQCNICNKDLGSQEELWLHIFECHLEFDEWSVAGSYENSQSANEDEEYQSDVQSEVIGKFIDEYKRQTRLWQTNHEEYRNKKMRKESYDILLEILREGFPNATQYEVLSKIKCFRSRFSIETRKMEAKKQKGDKYTPRIWYFKKLDFLASEMKINQKRVPRQKPVKMEVVNEDLLKNPMCTVCEKPFGNTSAWLDHVRINHDDKDFQSADGLFYCPICTFPTKTKRILVRHIRHEHVLGAIACTDCGKNFRFIAHLTKHRKQVHNDDNAFKCDECGKCFKNLNRLNLHQATHFDVNDRPHECEYCGARFSEKGNFAVHLRRHTKDYNKCCKLCGHKVATSTELRFHMLTHTKDYQIICDLCGRKFRSVTFLSIHKKEVHSEKLYKCDKCEKQFGTKRQLQLHSDSHKLIRDLKCDVCGSMFYRRSSLQRHKLRNHPNPIVEAKFEDIFEEFDSE